MAGGGTAFAWVPVAVSIALWSMVALYLSSVLFWMYEVVVVAPQVDTPESTEPLSDVQVRILCVDAEAVVQRTVDALPNELDDVHVVSESLIDVAGATVHVVPDEFECAAERKGRALEWAQRTLSCDRRFVLFLDEDTVVTDLDGVPDADIVQYGERPTFTGSYASWFCEVYRMGFQIEQRAFPWLDVPLYAWGGGLLVRAELEGRVTWNVDTLIEDTTFVWRAAQESLDFRFVPTKWPNQAPPSVRSLLRQRRRWLAGSRQENDVLSLDYWLLYGMRNLSWGLAPLMPLLLATSLVYSDIVFAPAVFRGFSVGLVSVQFAWGLIGTRYYRLSVPWTVAAVVLTPLLTVLHSAGALAGIVSPPSDFEVTEKVLPGAPERNRFEYRD